MQTVVVALLAVAAIGVAVLAQEGGRPPGIFKGKAQIGAELEASTPALGIVAGQTASVVAGTPH